MNINQTLGEFVPEFRLMLACATCDAVHPQTEEIKALLSQPLDWELFLQYTMQHRLYPLVNQTLGSLADAAVPETVFTALRTKCQKNTWQALRMVGETARIVAGLTENGIRSVVFKGPPLAQLLYGDVALRPSHDLDLLVRPEDLEAAGLVLERQGYRRIHPAVPLTPQLMRFLLQKDHHFAYCHGQTGILVELHWRMDYCGVALPLPRRDQLTVCRFAGREIPVAAAEYGLLLLVLHGAGHGWFRLRWLCDVGRYLRSELDWEKLLSLAVKFGVVAPLNQALLLAEQLFAAPIPDAYRSIMATDRRAWRLARKVIPFLQKADYNPDTSKQRRDWRLWVLQKKYDYQVRMSWKSRLGYVWSHFKPTETDLQLVKLPDSLHFLYYLFRPFTWVWRRISRLSRGRF
jgi:hypothetical protein